MLIGGSVADGELVPIKMPAAEIQEDGCLRVHAPSKLSSDVSKVPLIVSELSALSDFCVVL